MDKRILALFAALVATSIFGFNHTIAKELMPDVLSANALLYCRVLGAAICFWVISLFFKNEKSFIFRCLRPRRAKTAPPERKTGFRARGLSLRGRRIQSSTLLPPCSSSSSVRPGSRLTISDQRVPSSATPSRMRRSSSGVQSPFFTAGPDSPDNGKNMITAKTAGAARKTSNERKTLLSNQKAARN